MGVELGPQGWGTYIVQPADVTQCAQIVKADGNGGVFVWAYKKDSTGSPDFATTLNLVEGVYAGTPPPPQPAPVNPTTTMCSLTCPNCQKVLKLSATY